MVRLIIGKSASGKTLYLKRVLEQHNLDEVCTNLLDDVSLANTPYNRERIEILDDVLETATIEEQKTSLRITGANAPLTHVFDSIVTIICKDRDILILDEPCFGMTLVEKNKIVNFLSSAVRTFKEVYIVTHYEVMLGIPDIEILTVKMDDNSDKLETIVVPEEIADEVID